MVNTSNGNSFKQLNGPSSVLFSFPSHLPWAKGRSCKGSKSFKLSFLGGVLVAKPERLLCWLSKQRQVYLAQSKGPAPERPKTSKNQVWQMYGVRQFTKVVDLEEKRTSQKEPKGRPFDAPQNCLVCFAGKSCVRSASKL